MLDSLWLDLQESLLPMFSKFRADLSVLEVHRKTDKTLLSAADTAIERLLVSKILDYDGDAVIVAEEGTERSRRSSRGGRVYVIDPIDGTSEFVQAGHREFCSVVCVLEERRPVAAFVLAPELGAGGTPICVTAAGPDDKIFINGRHANLAGRTGIASATRARGTAPSETEKWLVSAGFRLKSRTTSQTLDMLRTAVDVDGCSDMELPSFEVFYRQNQKVWDGAAGMCFVAAAGKSVLDEQGSIRQLVKLDFTAPEPTFASTLAASTEIIMSMLAGPDALFGSE